ncbi:unnamed protein product [Symbiodinium natans]|uniref:Uncharacterized protein n=1 Tax=Symbiodinium natans TaxID=878477 RepID=A0A812M7J5_9DINO|nr:unnamed protein product [Symbiodinium natans]
MPMGLFQATLSGKPEVLGWSGVGTSGSIGGLRGQGGAHIPFVSAGRDHLARIRREQQHGQTQHREMSAWNRYHCKAVAALCEGLPAITVLACAWWSLNYPPENPLMKMSWNYERVILFISAGSGMVELDFCCSGAVAREMRKSLRYEMLHLLFRFCHWATAGQE